MNGQVAARPDQYLGGLRLHRGEKFYAVVKAAVSNEDQHHRQQHTEKGLARALQQLRQQIAISFSGAADASLRDHRLMSFK